MRQVLPIKKYATAFAKDGKLGSLLMYLRVRKERGKASN